MARSKLKQAIAGAIAPFVGAAPVATPVVAPAAVVVGETIAAVAAAVAAPASTPAPTERQASPAPVKFFPLTNTQDRPRPVKPWHNRTPGWHGYARPNNRKSSKHRRHAHS